MGYLLMVTSDKPVAPRHVAFVLIPDYSLIAFASAIEPLRLANQIGEQTAYHWSCHTLNGEPVRASNGLTTQPDGDLDTISGADLVVVCAGLNVEQQRHSAALLSRLRYLASHGATIGAICTGTYLLAKAGLLDNHRCTIHWENLRGFQEEFPHIEVTSELFEFDNRRVTSAGGTASLDMMLQFVATQEQTILSFKLSKSILIFSARSICLGIIIVKMFLKVFFISKCIFAQINSSSGCVLAAHHIFLFSICSKIKEFNLLSESFLVEEYFKFPKFFTFFDPKIFKIFTLS